MFSHNRLFPHQLLATLASGEEPSCDDLREVAATIWMDGKRGRTRARWELLTKDDVERGTALRAASLALIGSVSQPC